MAVAVLSAPAVTSTGAADGVGLGRARLRCRCRPTLVETHRSRGTARQGVARHGGQVGVARAQGDGGLGRRRRDIGVGRDDEAFVDGRIRAGAVVAVPRVVPGEAPRPRAARGERWRRGRGRVVRSRGEIHRATHRVVGGGARFGVVRRPTLVEAHCTGGAATGAVAGHRGSVGVTAPGHDGGAGRRGHDGAGGGGDVEALVGGGIGAAAVVAVTGVVPGEAPPSARCRGERG